MTKAALGGLSVVILAVAYSVYWWQSWSGKSVRPHPFSWLLWGSVTAVVYFAERGHSGGPGAWVVGVTSLLCLMTGCSSLIMFRWEFTVLDWVSIGTGAFIFLIYLTARGSMLAVVLATATDVVGYVPTVNKGWSEPDSDSVTVFWLNSVQYIPALFALESYSVTTCLYPTTLLLVNATVGGLLLWRRFQFKRIAH